MTGPPLWAKREGVDLFGIKLWPERSIEDEEFPEQRRRRWLLIWLFLALGIGAVLLRPVAVPAYRNFRADGLLERARDLMAAGDVSGARVSLERALQYTPTRVDVLEAMAEALRAEGSPRHASVLVQAALIGTNRADLAVTAVAACVTNGFAKWVAPIVDRLGAWHGTNAALWYWLGRALEGEDRQAEAAEAWQKAARLAPGDARLQLDVAIREVASKKAEVAVRGVERLEVLRRSPDAEISRGAAAAMAGLAMSTDARRAAAIWERYVTEYPDDWGAALSHLEAMGEADPTSVPARIAALWDRAPDVGRRLELAAVMARLRGPEAGFELMGRLSAQEKLAPGALVLRLELLAGMGRWAEVVEAAEVSAESRSMYSVDDQISVWGWLGVARRALADVSGFQTAIRALEALVGTNVDRAMRVGQALVSRGFDFEAAGFFRTASRPNSPRRYAALLALNDLYGRLGDQQKRLQTCEQLLQLDAGNPAVQSELASVKLELGWDREQALKLAREAWEGDRASYEFMEVYARALAMNGFAADGVAMYERMPPDVLGRDSVRLNYVESLMAAGRFADARLQLNQVQAARLPRVLQTRRDRIEIELRAR